MPQDAEERQLQQVTSQAGDQERCASVRNTVGFPAGRTCRVFIFLALRHWSKQPEKYAVLILVAIFGVVGCGGGAGGVFVPPTPPGAISGVLVDKRGGPAVSGAVVVAEGTTSAATSDSTGSFTMSGLTPSTYSLLVTKSGYGASRLQGVVVSSGTTTLVQMQMRTLFDPGKSTSAPTIAVSGLSSSSTVSGTISFTVSLSSANPMLRIEVRFGHRGDVPNAVFTDTSSANVTWATTTNANGSSFINIIGYDNNYNVAEWMIPVTINNSVSGGVPSPPSSVYATAITFGRSLNEFRLGREMSAKAGRLRGDPRRLPLLRERFVDIQAAPSDSTLFVYVLWSPVSGATGYRVYRSFSASGPFTLLADAGTASSSACAGIGFGGLTLCHRDSSPELAVGTTVYYRVTAYASAGESAQSATASTTPVAAFNLNLASPPDETATIPPGGIGTQTFSWTPGASVGTLQHYEGRVASVNDDPSVWWFFCVNSTTTITYGSGTCAGASVASGLQRAKRYEWDVVYAYAYASYTGGDAYGMAGFTAFGTFPRSSSGSLNGPFHFTTTP